MFDQEETRAMNSNAWFPILKYSTTATRAPFKGSVNKHGDVAVIIKQTAAACSQLSHWGEHQQHAQRKGCTQARHRAEGE